MKRSDVRDFLKNAHASLANIQSYYDETKRKHKKMDDGNGTYDPIEYWLAHIAIHTGNLRSKMNMRKYLGGADGKGKQFLTLNDGSLFKAYDGAPVVFTEEQHA